MLTELLGKGGNLCSHARAGAIRCPLIVRPTSEDAITGDLFGALGYINPRWWLPDLLNAGLGFGRFRRQVFRGFRIKLWQNQPCYPRELLPWEEGSTQVDVVLTWENPPTTVFIEAKYGSGLSAGVAGDDGSSGFPSDQLIRNIRVGLLATGHFNLGEQLFPRGTRDFAVLVLAPEGGQPLVERYRDERQLRWAIPHAEKLVGLPRGPFVGEVDYGGIRATMGRNLRLMTAAERRVAGGISDYLEFKRANFPDRMAAKPAGRPRGPALSLPCAAGGVLPILSVD